MDLGLGQKNYPGKVLVVDDDPDTRSIYQEVLSEAGYKVELAQDGQTGLAKILQGGYDFILLDIMMPKIDGLEILKKLKSSPPDSSVYNGPIIVLSALNQQQVIETAMSLGAKGYILKSDLNPGQIVGKISQILEEIAKQSSKTSN
ncbi:response regulator [Patescibacteria group bacterium]|nr:response regulator [Patescibacteria group bacterium]MCL5409690.1 response regulator [Patescibacteria group bacterium]